uniref:IgGFc_binding domain-containing protein n=1 Tax=Parastrongyloides trichosuri TaxID=131310 RepID=A0A0N4ZGM0_PARTI
MKYLFLISLYLIQSSLNVAATGTIGTEFVLSFPNIKLNNDHYKIFCSNDNYDYASIVVKWWSLKDKETKTDNFTITPLGYNEYIFDKTEVVFTSYSGYAEVIYIPENRITISSNIPIRVVANFYSFDPIFNNIHLVPSIESLGKNYMIQLPEPDVDQFQLIQLLPLEIDTKIELTHYVNGVLLVKSDLVLQSAFGSEQLTLVRQQSNLTVNSSFLIESDQPIAVVAAVTCKIISYNCIYLSFMPQALPSYANGMVDSKIFSLTDYTSIVTLLPRGEASINIVGANGYEITQSMPDHINTPYNYQFTLSDEVEYLINLPNVSVTASRHFTDKFGSTFSYYFSGSCITNLLPVSGFITGRHLIPLTGDQKYLEIYTDLKNMYNIILDYKYIYYWNPHVKNLLSTDFEYVALLVDLTQFQDPTILLYSSGRYMAYFFNIWNGRLGCYEIGYNN